MTDQEWVKALREHGVLPRVKQDPLPIGSSIGITFNTLDYEDLERLTRFFFSDDDRDELFEADCAILREQFGSELRCLPSVRLNFSFIPEFRYSVSAKRQEAYLRKAVRLITHVQTMTKHSRRKFPMRPRFELGFIWLSISNFHVTHGIVEQVHALLALDVRVESLSLPTNTRHVPYDEWRQAWAALLFTIYGHSKAAIRPRYPIDRLLIGFYHESPHLEEQYQAMFSVLAHATSIKEVIFNNLYARERVQTMWRRFLFAFFSKTSTTSVERVNISYYKMLWPEERVDVASVINARYPETQLLAGATSADDIYLGEVCLPYGAQIQLPSGRKITVDERRGETFMIIRSSTHLDIFVPGYGHGVVDNSVSPTRKRRRMLESRSSGASLKCLEFRDDAQGDEWSPLYESLLPRIGDRLESLIGNNPEYRDVHLQRILEYCPNLRTFRLFYLELSTIRSLIDAISSPRSLLTSLDVYYWHVPVDSVIELLQLLSDPLPSAAKRLTILKLNDDESSPALAEMLAKVVLRNRRLEFIRAFLSPTDHKVYREVLSRDSRIGESTKEVDQDGDGLEFGVPVTIESKVALLSLTRSTRACFKSLNCDILALIFAFAATPHIRSVDIQCYTKDIVRVQSELGNGTVEILSNVISVETITGMILTAEPYLIRTLSFDGMNKSGRVKPLVHEHDLHFARNEMVDAVWARKVDLYGHLVRQCAAFGKKPKLKIMPTENINRAQRPKLRDALLLLGTLLFSPWMEEGEWERELLYHRVLMIDVTRHLPRIHLFASFSWALSA